MDLQKIKKYAKEQEALLLQTLKELCLIPAPSGKEEKRAAYCKQWLEKVGAKGVYIDDALNVVYPMNCEGSNEITVFVAHTDTVFPDLEPCPMWMTAKRSIAPVSATILQALQLCC
jgi:acetylornithine deacetylase/succinyl-diaminopimelate desuccinylase-like protein